MMLKPKAARRLILVGVVCLLGILTITLLFGVRRWQNQRRTEQLRVDGLAAFDKSDYQSTIQNLSKLLRRTPQDREAWLALAEARENIEESGGKHLTLAAAAYLRAWTLDETDSKTGRRLLRLYNETGQAVEARDLAIRLRPSDLAAAGIADKEVLLEEANARISLKSFDSTLDEITQRAIDIDPSDYSTASMRVEYLLGAGRVQDAIAFANDRLSSRPDDPTAEFLQQFVLLKVGRITDPAAILTSICRIAGLDANAPKRVGTPTYTDPVFAGQLISLFDTIGLYGHSVLVLEDTATRLNDSQSRRLLVRRCWYAGMLSKVVADSAPTATTTQAGISEMLAFKALALHDMNQKADASAILDELTKQEDNYAAVAWSRVLPAVLQKLDEKEALDRLELAIRDHPSEPVFSSLKAEILHRLGRSDEARQIWSELHASNLSVGWAVPSVRVVETLLDEERIVEALKAAERARTRFPANPAVQLISIRAQAAAIESGRLGALPADMLRGIDAVLDQLSRVGATDTMLQARRMLLPARVTLLARLERENDARALVEREVSEPGFLTPDLASRLAGVSSMWGLGLDLGGFEAGIASGGSGSDLQGRAMFLIMAGKPDEAVQLVDTAFKTAPTPAKESTAIIRTWVYDMLGRTEAADLWKQTLREFPHSRAVHLAAIRSRTAVSSIAFVNEVAARLEELGSSDKDRPSSDVRLARAKATLAASNGPVQRDEAVAMLRSLLVDFPDRQEIREQLIEAVLLENPERNIKPDVVAAVEQLRAIPVSSPDRPEMVLRVADTLRRHGRAAEAVTELSNVSVDPDVQTPLRLEAIDRMADLGAFELALRGADSLVPASGPVPLNVAIRRGALLISLRRDREALAVYHSLLDQSITDPRVIITIASSLKSLGDARGAERATAKLNDPAISAKDRALARASLADGEKSVLEELIRACELAPSDARVWEELVRFHLRGNQLVEAEAAARRALKENPESVDLQILLQQVLLAGQSEETMNLLPLAEALARNPATARRAEAIRAVDAARSSGKLGDEAVLARLAEEFADDATIQIFVTRRLVESNPPRLAEAARIMRRAAVRFPTDFQVHRLASRTLLAAGDLEAALASATAWRALERNPAADLTVAEVQVSGGRARQALEAVREYSLPVPIEPSDSISLGVLSVRFRSHLILGGAAAAAPIIQPHLRDSAFIRTGIALPSTAVIARNPSDVQELMRLISAAADPGSEDEQIAIIQTWIIASNRLPAAAAEFLKEAARVSEVLCTSSPSSRCLEQRARVLELSGDLPAALAAARQAVAISADSPAALLTLSRIVIAAGADPVEAISSAERAVSATSDSTEAKNALLNARVYKFVSLSDKGTPEERLTARREALEGLQQLSSKSIPDYRIIFNMAISADQLEDYPSAIALYERIVTMPGGPTGAELGAAKNNLAYLLLNQNRSGPPNEAVFRARTLAEEAVRLVGLATIYETLGSINARIGDRPAAIAAYRKALEIDQNDVASLIGLAGLLVSGSSPEQDEASGILRRVDEQIASGKVLEPRRADEYNQIKKSLTPR